MTCPHCSSETTRELDQPAKQGTWCYLYRAIDNEGKLIDVRPSETRDMEAAKQCFEKVLATAGESPEKVTSDGRNAYRRAVKD